MTRPPTPNNLYKYSLLLVVLLLSSTVGFSQSAVAPASPSSTSYHFLTMYQQPYFFEVMIASLFGWILGMVKGFSGAKDWLENYWPNPPKLLLFFLDFLIFVACGAYLGTGIYNPLTFEAALAAGLTWPVGFGALVTREE